MTVTEDHNPYLSGAGADRLGISATTEFPQGVEVSTGPLATGGQALYGSDVRLTRVSAVRWPKVGGQSIRRSCRELGGSPAFLVVRRPFHR